MFSRSSTGSRFSALTAKTVVPMNIGTKLTARYGDLSRVLAEILKFQNPRAISYYANFVVPKMVEAIQKIVRTATGDRLVKMINSNQEIDPTTVEQLVTLCDAAIDIVTKMKDANVDDIVQEAWAKLESVLPIEYKDTLSTNPAVISPQFSHYLGLACEALIGIKGVVTGAKTDSTSISMSASDLTGTAGGSVRDPTAFAIVADLAINVEPPKALDKHLEALKNVAHGAEMVHAIRVSSVKTEKFISDQAKNVEKMIDETRERAKLAYDDAVIELQRLGQAEGYENMADDRLLLDCRRATKEKFPADLSEMLSMLMELNEAVEEIRLKMSFGGIKSQEMLHFISLTTGLSNRGKELRFTDKSKYTSISAIAIDLTERVMSEKTFITALRAWGEASGKSKSSKKFYAVTDDNTIVFNVPAIVDVYCVYMAYKIALECVEFNAFGTSPNHLTAKYNHCTNIINGVIAHVSKFANPATGKSNAFYISLIEGLFVDTAPPNPTKTAVTAERFNQFWSNFVSTVPDRGLTPYLENAVNLRTRVWDMMKTAIVGHVVNPAATGAASDLYAAHVAPFELAMVNSTAPWIERRANLSTLVARTIHPHAPVITDANLKFEQAAFEFRVALDCRNDPLLGIFRSLMNNLYHLIGQSANGPANMETGIRTNMMQSIIGGASTNIEKGSIYPAAVAMLTMLSYAKFVEGSVSTAETQALVKRFGNISASNTDPEFFATLKRAVVKAIVEKLFDRLDNSPAAIALRNGKVHATTGVADNTYVDTLMTIPAIVGVVDLSSLALVTAVTDAISGDIHDPLTNTTPALHNVAHIAAKDACKRLVLERLAGMGNDFGAVHTVLDSVTIRDNSDLGSIIAEAKAAVVAASKAFFVPDQMAGPEAILFKIANNIIANKENFETIDATTFTTCVSALNTITKENGDDVMMIATRIRSFIFNHLFVRDKATKFIDSGMDDMRLIEHFTTAGFDQIIKTASESKLGEYNVRLMRKCEEFSNMAEYGMDDAFKKVIGYMMKRIDSASEVEKKELADGFKEIYEDLNTFVGEAERMITAGIPSNFNGDLQSQDSVCGSVAKALIVAMQDGVKLRHTVEPWRRNKIDEVLRMMQDYDTGVYSAVSMSECDPFGTAAAYARFTSFGTAAAPKPRFNEAMKEHLRQVKLGGGLMNIRAEIRAAALPAADVRTAYYVVNWFTAAVRICTLALGGAVVNASEHDVFAAPVANPLGHTTVWPALVPAISLQTFVDAIKDGKLDIIRSTCATAIDNDLTAMLRHLVNQYAHNMIVSGGDAPDVASMANVSVMTDADNVANVVDVLNAGQIVPNTVLTELRVTDLVSAIVAGRRKSEPAVARMAKFLADHGPTVTHVNHDAQVALKRAEGSGKLVYYHAESNNSLHNYGSAARSDYVGDTANLYAVRSLTKGTKAHYDYQLINREPRTFEEFMAAIANFSSLMIGFGYSAQSIIPFAFYHELREAKVDIATTSPHDPESHDADFMQRIYNISCKLMILDKMFRFCITPIELMVYSQSTTVAKTIFSWFVDEISMSKANSLTMPNFKLAPHITAHQHLFTAQPARANAPPGFVCDIHGNQAMQLLNAVETVSLGPFTQHFANTMGLTNLYRQVRAIKYRSSFDDHRLLPLMAMCMNVDPGFARYDEGKGSYVPNINFTIERLQQPIIKARGVYDSMFATAGSSPTAAATSVAFIKHEDVVHQIELFKPASISSYMMTDTVSCEQAYAFEIFDNDKDKTKIMIRSTVEAVNRIMNNGSGATPFAIWNSGASLTPYQTLSLCAAAYVMSNIVSGKLPQDFISIIREKFLNAFNFGSRQYSFSKGSKEHMIQIPDGAICHTVDRTTAEPAQINESDFPVCLDANGDHIGTSRIAIARDERHALDAATLLLIRSIDRAQGISADDIAATSAHVNKILANSAIFFTFFNKIYNMLNFIRTDIDEMSGAEHGKAIEMARIFASICEDMYVRFKDKNTFRTIAGEHPMSKLRGKDKKPVTEVAKFRLNHYQQFIRSVYANKVHDSADLWGLVPIDQIFTKAHCSAETLVAVFPAMTGFLDSKFEFANIANDLSDLWLANYAVSTMKWLTISPIGHPELFDSIFPDAIRNREMMIDSNVNKHWTNSRGDRATFEAAILTEITNARRTDINAYQIRIPAKRDLKGVFGGASGVPREELVPLANGVMAAVGLGLGANVFANPDASAVYQVLAAWYNSIRGDLGSPNDEFGQIVRGIQSIGEQNMFLDTIWKIFIQNITIVNNRIKTYLAENASSWARRWDVVPSARMLEHNTLGTLTMREAITSVQTNAKIISEMCLFAENAGTGAATIEMIAEKNGRITKSLTDLVSESPATGSVRAFKSIGNESDLRLVRQLDDVERDRRAMLNLLHEASATKRVGSVLNTSVGAVMPSGSNHIVRTQYGSTGPVPQAPAGVPGLAGVHNADMNAMNAARVVPAGSLLATTPGCAYMAVPVVSAVIRNAFIAAVAAATVVSGAGGNRAATLAAGVNLLKDAAVVPGSFRNLFSLLDSHDAIVPVAAQAAMFAAFDTAVDRLAAVVNVAANPAQVIADLDAGYDALFYGMLIVAAQAAEARYAPRVPKDDLAAPEIALHYAPFVSSVDKYSAKIVAVASTMFVTTSFADSYILIGLGIVDAPNDVNDLGGLTSDAILSFRTNVAEVTKTKMYDGYLSPLNVFDQAVVICPYANAALYKNWNYGIREQSLAEHVPAINIFTDIRGVANTLGRMATVFEPRDLAKDTQSWLVKGSESDDKTMYLAGFSLMTSMGLKAFDSRNLNAQAHFIQIARTSLKEAKDINEAITSNPATAVHINMMSADCKSTPNTFFAGAFPQCYEKMRETIFRYRSQETSDQ